MDTISKRLLLNFLYMAKKDLTISELSSFIESITDGQYIITKVNTSKIVEAGKD